jgi:di/tricarboxylate transporter
MSLEIAFVLALVVIVTVVLIREWLRPDLTALLVLIILGVTGIVAPDDLFSGFSRQAVITILALSIITDGLELTGATRTLGQMLQRAARVRTAASNGALGRPVAERRAVLVLSAASALLSLIMNTIAAAAVLLPAALGVARQSGMRNSKLLIPLSFGALLGGMATLFTTANILVSNALEQRGYTPYGVLDFVPVGLPMAIAGVVTIAALAPRLLPERVREGEEVVRRGTLSDAYQMSDEVRAVYVKPGSALAGQSLADGNWGGRLGLNVLALSRGGSVTLAPPRTERVREGDIVMFTGTIDATELDRYGLVFTSDPDWNRQLASDEISLVEVTLTPRSSLAGKTLRDIRFRDRYALTVLAIWREGTTLRDALAEIPLKFGDALLMQGARRPIELLRRDPNWLVLEEDFGDAQPRLSLRAGIALILTALAVVVPLVTALPIAESTFAAAFLMVLTGCLSMDEAYSAIEWRAIFLIAGMLPLGLALADTGAAALIGDLIVSTVGAWGPLALSAGLFVATVLLTQILSGQVTPVILAPIAIAAAEQIGADPRGVAMAVALACSTAFLTPISHSANLLVMGPGGYQFRDYARLGLPLTLVLFVVMLVGLAVVWGIR